MRIAQLSDIHVLDARFEAKLLDAAIEEINAEEPDLVIVAGDLTAAGYREEFEYAREQLDRLACPEVVVVPGNHDSRSAGFLHYEDLFGERWHARALSANGVRAQVVCVDSSKPDLDEGSVGREHYAWIYDSFAQPADLRLFVLHHHLVAIPGTGRDRNQVWDAGDVLEVLRACGVDVVFGGHRHVPHVWPIAELFLVHSGTVSTWRVRGYTRPSYNVTTITDEEISVEMREPGGRRELLASYPRPLRPLGEHHEVPATRVVNERGTSDMGSTCSTPHRGQRSR